MKRYRIAVLDDDKNVLKAIVEMLLREGYDVDGYDEAEKLLAAFDTCLPPREPPDLVLVDIQLKPRKMQGMAVVAELAGRNNVDSAIVVMSGSLAGTDLVDATRLGAVAGLPKPFDRSTLISTVERLAGTTRRRRTYRAQANTHPNNLDPSRLYRPVFLSYSSKDDAMANGLRLNIEARGIPVWYAPTTIAPGDQWKSRIEAGIGQAKIFVALLTDNYVFASSQCIDEFCRFQDRVFTGPEPKPLILPVLSALSNDARESVFCRPILDRYQYVDISKRFIDGLTALLLRIEGILGSMHAAPRKNRSRDASGASDKNPIFVPPHSGRFR